MKRILSIALLALAATSALAQAPERLERRVAQLEQTVARLEKRITELEAKLASSDRRGMMGGGGMMGDGKPNEQWRSPDSGR